MKKLLTSLLVLALASSAWAAKQTLPSVNAGDTWGTQRGTINTAFSRANDNFTELYTDKADASCFASEAAFNACFDLTWATGGSGDDLGNAAYSDVVALWATCTGYLKSDGTCDTPSGSATYPSAVGVANWNGSAWGTSYTVGTSANNLVQLNGSAQLPAVSAALLTNFPTLNQNTTGTAAGLSAQYVDWSASSGGASIANKPSISGLATSGITGNLTLSKTGSTARTATFPDATGTVALTTSNVATASALAANPTDCSAGQYATTIAANGNLTCAQVAYSQISGTPTTEELTASGMATIAGLTGNSKYWGTNAGGTVGVYDIPTGGSMTWPGSAGIAVYGGSSAWGTSLTAPSGAIVGTTDTQSLSNKTLPSFELGSAATDTTITRASAGVMAIEGVTVTRTIASNTTALGTSAISSGACATVVTATATGTATTDTIGWGFNGDPTSTTGYQASANGMLTIIAYPTANNVNFKVCNNTSASITPGAISINWKVFR